MVENVRKRTEQQQFLNDIRISYLFFLKGKFLWTINGIDDRTETKIIDIIDFENSIAMYVNSNFVR